MESDLDPAAPFPRSIRGRLRVTYALKKQQVFFNMKTDAGAEKKVGDVTITYTGLKKDEESDSSGWHVLLVRGDVSKVSPFLFKDEAGNPVRAQQSGDSTSTGSIELWYNFRTTPAIATCTVATEVVVRTYPFEFKDTVLQESR